MNCNAMRLTLLVPAVLGETVNVDVNCCSVPQWDIGSPNGWVSIAYAVCNEDMASDILLSSPVLAIAT